MREYEKLLGELSVEEKELFVKNRYGYIFSKAKLFLKIGPRDYLAKDFFEIDVTDLDEEDFEILKNGCEQILKGKGLTVDNPFENLGVLGFAKLFEIFHFSSSKIETLKPEPMKFLDVMSVEHFVDGAKAKFFNLISY